MQESFFHFCGGSTEAAKLRDATKEEPPTSLRIITFSGIRVLVSVVGARQKKMITGPYGVTHEPHCRKKPETSNIFQLFSNPL